MLIGTKRQSQIRRNNHILARIIAGLIMVFAFASAVALYFEQESRMDRINLRRHDLEQQAIVLQLKNEELHELKSLVDTEAYIERVARDQLGMVKPNEIIFEE